MITLQVMDGVIDLAMRDQDMINLDLDLMLGLGKMGLAWPSTC